MKRDLWGWLIGDRLAFYKWRIALLRWERANRGRHVLDRTPPPELSLAALRGRP